MYRNVRPLSLKTDYPDLPEMALSVRQPWPWAMFNAGKGIENRVWSTNIRGQFCIHASTLMARSEYEACLETIRAIRGPQFKLPRFDEADLPRGGIVGVATLVACVARSSSPWFFGPYGFVLEDVRPVPFIPVKGKQGWFRWRERIIGDMAA